MTLFKNDEDIDISKIVQLTDKLTQRQAEDIGSKSDTLTNLSSINKNLYEFFKEIYTSPELTKLISSSKAVKELGDPLVKMRGYESTPGLWMFDDIETGTRFLIWSDGYKKNPWKGTSVEAIVNTEQIKTIDVSFKRLVKFIGSKFG